MGKHGQHHRAFGISQGPSPRVRHSKEKRAVGEPSLNRLDCSWADERETPMGAFTRHSVEFDAFELGNRYMQGRGIGGRPLLTRLSGSLSARV